MEVDVRRLRFPAGPLLVIVAASLVAPLTYAANHLGWADAFISADVQCANDNCTGYAVYANGTGTYLAQRWQFVGGQGTDSEGRANARERVNFNYRDDNLSCSTQTVQIARYRTTSVPSVGTTCGTHASFVGTASTTIDSCQFTGNDTYNSNRLTPEMNFSAETAVGAIVGYRSVMTYTNQLGVGGSATSCFKIEWY
jgi:hypothetical protein